LVEVGWVVKGIWLIAVIEIEFIHEYVNMINNATE
jgi:hypothetical protein